MRLSLLALGALLCTTLQGAETLKPEEDAQLALYSALAQGRAKPQDADLRNAGLEALKVSGQPSPDFLDRLKAEAGKAAEEVGKAAGPEAARRLRSQRRSSIARAREKALGIIRNKSHYPDKDHGAEGQSKVDEALGKLGAMATPGEGTLAAPLAAFQEIAGVLRAFGVEAPASPDGAALARKLDSLFFDALVPADDLKALNAAREALAKADAEVASCFLATCRYRMLMGLKPLALDARLMAAAQLHADDMAKQDYFSHDSKDGRKPIDRTQAQDFPSRFIAENIAYGRKTGEAALDGWQHSSGHHRNLLGPDFQFLGVGRTGTKWVQVLGGIQPRKAQRE